MERLAFTGPGWNGLGNAALYAGKSCETIPLLVSERRHAAKSFPIAAHPLVHLKPPLVPSEL